MATVNYAEAYSKELANAYGYTLYFGKLWSTDNTDKYKPVDANTIKIPHIKTGGRTDGSRDSIGSFTRNWDNDWEPKKLSNHRTWQTLVHPNDISQTNTAASIANITKTMNETQKFPEMDAYLVSRLYALKNEIEEIPTRLNSVLNKNTVLNEFDKMMDAMDEACVPPSGRILYVDTYTKTLIDNAKEIYRSNGDSRVVKNVSRIDEVEVVSVPTRLMKTAYSFTSGWAVAENAEQIKMLLVHPSCVLPIASYAFAQLSEPSAMSQGKYVYFEESFEDVFILNERHAGIQMLVCYNADLGDITVTSAADETTSGSSVITATPAAASGNSFVYKLANSYAAFEYGEELSEDEWTALPSNGIIACGSSTKITVAEITADFKAVARGTAVLKKKA